VLGNGCAPARSSSGFADRRLAQPREPDRRDARKPWDTAQGYGYPGPRVTQVRSVAGLTTQWLLRRTRPAKVTSRSPANRKPRERQMPFDGLLVVAGNACTSPHRPSSRASSRSIRTACLASPRPLELRQDHPADLGDRLAVLVVGPQRDRSRHHVRCGLAGDDHLDPLLARRGRLDIAGDLVLDALAGQRAAQFGHHGRVAPHPHVGADVAHLDIPQPHLLLPCRPGLRRSCRRSRGSYHHLRACRQNGAAGHRRRSEKATSSPISPGSRRSRTHPGGTGSCSAAAATTTRCPDGDCTPAASGSDRSGPAMPGTCPRPSSRPPRTRSPPGAQQLRVTQTGETIRPG
jgi:hypothetical protein